MALNSGRVFKAGIILVVLAVSACQTTGSTRVYSGYEAGGMCNGGAHCGGGR